MADKETVSVGLFLGLLIPAISLSLGFTFAVLLVINDAFDKMETRVRALEIQQHQHQTRHPPWP